jgi:hypothetical protein
VSASLTASSVNSTLFFKLFGIVSKKSFTSLGAFNNSSYVTEEYMMLKWEISRLSNKD